MIYTLAAATFPGRPPKRTIAEEEDEEETFFMLCRAPNIA